MSEIDAVKREIDTYKMFLKIREQQAKKGKYKNYSQEGLIDEILEKEEEIHKKEAMYDSLAVDYRLAQEEIERLKNDIKRITEITNQKIKIIKEVREYIEEKKYSFCDDYDLRCEDGKEILEILDKGSE